MKHFLHKRTGVFFGITLSFVLVFFSVATLVFGQTIKVEKDLDFQNSKQILNIGGIRFSDASVLNSASAVGGGGWTVSNGKVYPTAGGNVGIGTTDPMSQLYVVGTTTIAGVLQVGGGGSIADSGASTPIYRTVYYDSDNTAYFTDPANAVTAGSFSGNIGIGTTVPLQKLDVRGNIYIPTPNGITWSNGDAQINAVSGYHLQFSTYTGAALTEKMRITSGGNVGIATTTPGSKLHVNGSVVATGFNDPTVLGGVLGGDGTNALVYGRNGSAGWAPMLLDATKVYINSQSGGNVGIGTNNPLYKLHVSGVMYADEGTSAADIIANKIDATTVDPVYTIGGKRYATYLPGMIGIKEEMTGILHLKPTYGTGGSQISNIYQTDIDFQNAEEGSDAWLFAKATNLENAGLDNLAVLVTPNFDGKVWYVKSEESKKITIYAELSDSQIGNSPEVSYRLTAPRFDHKEWTNYSLGQWEGLNLDAFLSGK